MISLPIANHITPLPGFGRGLRLGRMVGLNCRRRILLVFKTKRLHSIKNITACTFRSGSTRHQSNQTAAMASDPAAHAWCLQHRHDGRPGAICRRRGNRENIHLDVQRIAATRNDVAGGQGKGRLLLVQASVAIQHHDTADGGIHRPKEKLAAEINVHDLMAGRGKKGQEGSRARGG